MALKVVYGGEYDMQEGLRHALASTGRALGYDYGDGFSLYAEFRHGEPLRVQLFDDEGNEVKAHLHDGKWLTYSWEEVPDEDV